MKAQTKGLDECVYVVRFLSGRKEEIKGSREKRSEK